MEILKLSDGSQFTVADIYDALEIVDHRLGYELKDYIESYINEQYDIGFDDGYESCSKEKQ